MYICDNKGCYVNLNTVVVAIKEVDCSCLQLIKGLLLSTCHDARIFAEVCIHSITPSSMVLCMWVIVEQKPQHKYYDVLIYRHTDRYTDWAELLHIYVGLAQACPQ